jgi:hypothetical protein
MDRDTVVTIAARNWLDVPEIESRCGARFSEPAHTNPGAHPASYALRTGSLTESKVAGAWRLPPNSF